MIPAFLKIGGLEVSVEQSTSLAVARDKFGEYSFMEQKITLDSNLPESKKTETLMHEILEALNGYLQLEMPHDKLSALSFALHQVMRENKLEF